MKFIGTHLRVYNNNLHLFIASSSSPTAPPLDADYLDYSMAARTKLNEGTESADNRVAELEGAQGHYEAHQHNKGVMKGR